MAIDRRRFEATTSLARRSQLFGFWTEVHREPHAGPENPIHSRSDPETFWTTTNVGEAVPGVCTPLGWSLWGPALDQTLRTSFSAIGALPNDAGRAPTKPNGGVVRAFYGRAAVSVSFLCEMGDRVPGTSGEAVATQILGSAPPGVHSRSHPERYPMVAARFPATFATGPARVRRCRETTGAWWKETVPRAGSMELPEAKAELLGAVRRFDTNLITHGVVNLSSVQPVFDQLQRLLAAAGAESGELLAGHGTHEETALVKGLWEVSRGHLSLDGFLAEHGYHGYDEGDVGARVWREDPAPLLAMIDGYRSLSDPASPVLAEAGRAEARRRAEAELLAAVSAWQRPRVGLVLRLANHRLPLRGVGKVAFLMALDVVRAIARRLGNLLADQGTLESPDDVFFFTVEELCFGLPPDARALVERRRRHYEEYQLLDIPQHWSGMPDAQPREATTVADDGAVLQGVGASAGVVEGPVRVMSDPGAAEIEPGEVLVAHTTDPSWAAVMFLASALVVDIGGLFSHAAIVARELGVPCVMGTKVGTQVLRTGDRCRIDGGAGTVEVLKRRL